jgi:hypothetical protein
LQATFAAINVEPEENIDEEVDITKDIQVCCAPIALMTPGF